MSYLPYVIAAYAVFVAMILWEWVSPLLQIRRVLRMAKLHAARACTRRNDTGSAPTQ